MNTTKLAKADSLMNQLVFYLHAKGMTYKQAKEEVFKMMKRKRLSNETEDDWVYMAWQEQKRKRVATTLNVYELLEAAFQTAKQLRWTREQFILIAEEVSKAEKIPK